MASEAPKVLFCGEELDLPDPLECTEEERFLFFRLCSALVAKTREVHEAEREFERTQRELKRARAECIRTRAVCEQMQRQ